MAECKCASSRVGALTPAAKLALYCARASSRCCWSCSTSCFSCCSRWRCCTVSARAPLVPADVRWPVLPSAPCALRNAPPRPPPPQLHLRHRHRLHLLFLLLPLCTSRNRSLGRLAFGQRSLCPCSCRLGARPTCPAVAPAPAGACLRRNGLGLGSWHGSRQGGRDLERAWKVARRALAPRLSVAACGVLHWRLC